jgi:hypothetical protein
MRKAAALAFGLIAAALPDLAAARAMTVKECDGRKQSCEFRCFDRAKANNKDTAKVMIEYDNCNKRTCHPQHASCVRDASDSKGGLSVSPGDPTKTKAAPGKTTAPVGVK